MIDITARIPLDADLDAVLAIADEDRLAYCERCGSFVPEDESGESELTGETICLACYDAEQDEQAAIRAEVHADLDLLHAAAQACPVDLYDDSVPF